ncbi:hypothetical protein ACFCXT_38915, partial [Streptomyces vinaceus]
GGPNDSTRPILEYIYDVGFTGYRLGYASAISYLFFALIMVISLAPLRFFRVRPRGGAADTAGPAPRPVSRGP